MLTLPGQLLPAPSPPLSSYLPFPVHRDNWREESITRSRDLHPNPLEACLWEVIQPAACPSLVASQLSELAKCRGVTAGPDMTFSLTHTLLQPRCDHSLLQVPTEGMLAFSDARQREVRTLCVKPNP